MQCAAVDPEWRYRLDFVGHDRSVIYTYMDVLVIMMNRKSTSSFLQCILLQSLSNR